MASNILSDWNNTYHRNPMGRDISSDRDDRMETMTNFQPIKISRKQQMIKLSWIFGLFWIPKRSLLKSSFPKLKNTWQNFPTQKNPKIENFKPQKILRSSLSLEIMRSTHPPGHRKLLMSSSRPTPLGPCRHSLFQAFGYWSAVWSRRAGKKIRRMRGLSPPTTPPRCFFFLLLLLFFVCSHLFPHEKKYTVSQPVNSNWVSLKEIDCRTGANIFFCAFYAITAKRTWSARHAQCMENKFCRL